MTEQLDTRVELGKAMWNVQADNFFACVKRNNVESAEDLAALFAGFMASATGAMIHAAGPKLAMSVLGAVSKSCAAQTVEQYISGEDSKKARMEIIISPAGGGGYGAEPGRYPGRTRKP